MPFDPKYADVYFHIQKEFEQYNALPMSVYVTAMDGCIVMYNETACTFFSFDKEKNWIQKYYRDEADRKRIMESLKQKQNGDWYKNKNVEFVIKGEIKSLRFFIKPYFTDSHEFVGFLCLTFEIKHLERFRHLNDVMPVSIFEIANGHKVIYANEASNELFNSKDLKGQEAKSLFINEEDYFSIVDNLKTNKKSLINELVRLKKNDMKAAFWGKLTIVPEFDAGGKLIKSKGVLMEGRRAGSSGI